MTNIEKNKKIGKRKFLEDKNGIFGLTAIQEFFIVLLGVALLGFVIVIIMGTLLSSSTNIIPGLGTTVSNETGGWFNSSGYILALLM